MADNESKDSIPHANEVTLRRGDVIVSDDATTTAIKFKDCSAAFRGTETSFYVRVYVTQVGYVLPVAAEDETLTTAEMDLFAPNIPEGFILERSAPVIAYSADAGIIRVRRASPPKV